MKTLSLLLTIVLLLAVPFVSHAATESEDQREHVTNGGGIVGGHVQVTGSSTDCPFCTTSGPAKGPRLYDQTAHTPNLQPVQTPGLPSEDSDNTN